MIEIKEKVVLKNTDLYKRVAILVDQVKPLADKSERELIIEETINLLVKMRREGKL